jgi:SprT protein
MHIIAKPYKAGPAELLVKYVPESTVDTVCEWIQTYDFILKITKSRDSKYGDYRSPFAGKGHRISVNHDLNKYSFFITLVHEVAHLLTWERHRDNVFPHGKEWKHFFKELMVPFLSAETFPDDVLSALSSYIKDPAASSCVDATLIKVLKRYDHPDGSILVEQIPEGSIFRLKNGMVLRKGLRLRKRFKCLEVKSKKTYLVSPVAEAVVIPARKNIAQLQLF